MNVPRGLIVDTRADDAPKLAPFAPLIGRWDMEITDIRGDGRRSTVHGTWEFAWGLGGRAVLDVWSVPGREQGLTVRFWDPAIEALRSTWLAPASGLVQCFLGRYTSDEIVLELQDGSGTRWIFSGIGATEFRWRSERPDQTGPFVEQTMIGRRAG